MKVHAYSKNLKATTVPYRENRPIRSPSHVVGLPFTQIV